MWQTHGSSYIATKRGRLCLLTNKTKMVQNQLDLFKGLYFALTLSFTVSYSPFSLWYMCTQMDDFMIIPCLRTC